MASSSTPTPTHLACTLCKVIQQSLDDFDYENALYVAEWMMIQVPQFEEANYFLAKCLYLLHRPKLAIPLLSHLQPSQHRFSRYLLARIYLDLDLFFEAEQALLQTPLESGVLPNLFQDPKHQGEKFSYIFH
ncbi:hypothetical protein HMI54_011260 [Coelomomyces lativittatus]|nr:hypothetical protein HMI56_005471 [Coelomomyces lativittatus]KAJ1497883.1 hypothetical protein HMI55_005251 [Coelomomyces lativittatus]KAJ1499920.1 hypothetical protein HMI54_011260 [Coelomomyces lativittatus]